ncbi:hypothetical protein U9M48_038694 [Paspalum notatum var. saurae]|uniref:Uncharacterized protein n=1 Tax=Paspalum notatum var. saurae TaxID=547442 RepID=A0AAQ3ULW0_PASNO
MASECGEGKQADCKKTPWTAAEDEALRRAVREHGRQNWAAIAGAVAAGRGAKSCRLRWCQHLAPGLDSRPFTPEEDAIIVEQQRVHGNKWATIARYLHGRSDNAIKNRWNSALRKMQQGDDLAAAPPACLDLFPLKARAIGEDTAADRLVAREESDVALIGLKLGSSPGLSDAELALSLGPVRPSSNRGQVASFRPSLQISEDSDTVSSMAIADCTGREKPLH